MQVITDKAIDKQIQKLPTIVRNRIRRAVNELELWPDVSNVKSLKGEKNKHRKRVGDYRIVFRIEGTNIVVEDIEHRKDVYRG